MGCKNRLKLKDNYDFHHLPSFNWGENKNSTELELNV